MKVAARGLLSRNILWSVCVAVMASSSCAVRALELEFVNDVNIATGAIVDGAAFGGISGLTYNPGTQSCVGISDDRSALAPARCFNMTLTLVDDQLSVSPISKTTLHRLDGSEFPKGSIDGEGIVYHKSGKYFISSEGDGKTIPRLAPSIFVSDTDGKVQSEVQIPAKFIPNPTGTQVKGVVNNGAFEGLSLSPSGKFLFALLESPLTQDDTVADFEKGSLNRGIVFTVNDLGETEVQKEFVYPVEAVQHKSPNDGSGGNGVSEVLAISDNELIVMERGGTVTPEGEWTTQVKIFKVNIQQASDVSSFETLKNRNYELSTKVQVLDLETILPRLQPGFQSLDNLEALVLGPKTSKSDQTLIIASDNNFSDTQRSQFLLFKIK